MAKFTSQEVSALQGGGNASAKEIYLKEWDPQRQSLPDGSNVERLRDFIKHVYVDRRYTGERSFDKPPRVKMGESEDINENRRMDNYHSGSRSPPYDDVNERRYSDRSSPGGRSPGYDQGNRQFGGDYKKSPAQTEIVNDWRREDRFGNGRRSEDSRLSDGSSGLDGRSPDRQRDQDSSSPPVVRPVREILGENVTPLRVIEPPKVNGARSADGPLRTQRTTSSSSLASSNGNPAEIKIETSLIDFDAAPEPPAPAAMPQPQQSATALPVAQNLPSGGDNWANFDSVSEVKASQTPVSANSLESVLSELSMPASNPGPTTVGSLGLPFGTVAPPAAGVNTSATFPSGAPVANPGLVHAQPTPAGNAFAQGPWQQQQPHSLFPAMGGQPSVQNFMPAPVGPLSSQPWNPLIAPHSQGHPTSASFQASHPVVKPNLEVGSGMGSLNSSVEVKSSERKALPEDLFAVNYPLYPAPVPGWHIGPAHGMGFAVQYSMQMPPPAFSQAKSSNPFDVNNDPSPALAPAAAPTFPSMASLHGALPTMTAPGGLLRTSSLGTPASNPSAIPHAHSFPSMMPSNSYMGQQLPGNILSRPHGQVNNIGLENAGFGPISNQHLGGLQSTPAPPNTFSSLGGNPFG